MLNVVSSSLVFQNGNKYLLALEKRRLTKDGPKDSILLHPIGGKVEEINGIIENGLQAACREFKEETRFNLETYKNLSKRSKEIKMFIKCVGREKNHKYYIVNLDKFPEFNEILTYDFRPSGTDSIVELVWLTIQEMRNNLNKSDLVKTMIDKL